jgi:hypothetical protein
MYIIASSSFSIFEGSVNWKARADALMSHRATVDESMLVAIVGISVALQHREELYFTHCLPVSGG